MNWGRKYLCRLLGRNPGRSLLSLLLAALLAFAFGLVTVLRGIYGELYQHVEVKPVLSHIGYERAMKVVNSGYVRDPYFETYCRDCEIQMTGSPAYFLNRFDKLLHSPEILWAEGWDEETFLNTKKQVCVLYSSFAEELGVELGDKVRVNEENWLANISQNGNPFEPGETIEQLRDRRRPFATVAGIIQNERWDNTSYFPVASYVPFSCLFPMFYLDIAEFTLMDYHCIPEFRTFIQEILDGTKSAAKFHMDTGNADRIYKIHRLLETLYPLTIAAALLLACVLPGLTVLHGSREISILRALGAKARKCVGIYTLAQVLCAFVGLILGFVLVTLIQRPDPGTVMRPFALYLLAHLAACALGSGIFAWLCARKHVLAQLQAKE